MFYFLFYHRLNTAGYPRWKRSERKHLSRCRSVTLVSSVDSLGSVAECGSVGSYVQSFGSASLKADIPQCIS